MVVAAKLKQLVGKATKPKAFEVEKGQVRRFAAAIGETNPIHFDEAAAKAAGYSSIVGTPTFAAAFHAHDELYESLGIDAVGSMHAEEEYEYFKPICAGDTIEVTHKVVDAYEKSAQNGKLVFIVLETKATDKRGRDVFKGRRILVELHK